MATPKSRHQVTWQNLAIAMTWWRKLGFVSIQQVQTTNMHQLWSLTIKPNHLEHLATRFPAHQTLDLKLNPFSTCSLAGPFQMLLHPCRIHTTNMVLAALMKVVFYSVISNRTGNPSHTSPQCSETWMEYVMVWWLLPVWLMVTSYLLAISKLGIPGGDSRSTLGYPSAWVVVNMNPMNLMSINEALFVLFVPNLLMETDSICCTGMGSRIDLLDIWLNMTGRGRPGFYLNRFATMKYD